VQVKVTVVCVG